MLLLAETAAVVEPVMAVAVMVVTVEAPATQVTYRTKTQAM